MNKIPKSKELITLNELAKLYNFNKSKLLYWFELGILGKPHSVHGKALLFLKADACKKVEAYWKKVSARMAKRAKA